MTRPVHMSRGRALQALGLAGLALVGALSLPATAHAWEPLRSMNGDVQQGNALLAKGEAKAALGAYDRAARALPDAPGVHLNRGIALLNANEPTQAREALRLAATSEADAALRAQAFYNLGLSFYHEADAAAGEDQHDQAQSGFREAADAFRRSLRLKPGNRDAAWNLELALRRIAEEKEKADEQKQADDEEKEKGEDGEKEQSDDGEKEPNQDGEGEDGERDKQDSPPGDDDSEQQDAAPKDDADSQDKPEESSPQDQPEEDPAASDPDPGQEAPTDADDDIAPPSLPSDVSRALDALQADEQSLEQVRARQRAGGRRPPVKDW